MKLRCRQILAAACFEPPTTPQGCDELAIAGSLRGSAIELAKCVAIDEYSIAHAEVVIEGELIPGVIGHVLDPTQNSKYNPDLIQNGTTCKTIFDCTVPGRSRTASSAPSSWK